jgi:hypothetical protein
MTVVSSSKSGSGGCVLLVLEKTVVGYRKVSGTTATWAPVVVSERRTRGWNDLILWQRSYGAEDPSRYFVLAFDGSRYPLNPSVAPARPLAEPARGVAYMFDRKAVGIEYRRTP